MIDEHWQELVEKQLEALANGFETLTEGFSRQADAIGSLQNLAQSAFDTDKNLNETVNLVNAIRDSDSTQIGVLWAIMTVGLKRLVEESDNPRAKLGEILAEARTVAIGEMQVDPEIHPELAQHQEAMSGFIELMARDVDRLL